MPPLRGVGGVIGTRVEGSEAARGRDHEPPVDVQGAAGAAPVCLYKRT